MMIEKKGPSEKSISPGDTIPKLTLTLRQEDYIRHSDDDAVV